MNKLFFFSAILLATLACKETGKKGGRSVVTLDIENAYNQVIYVETVPSLDNKITRLDSVFIKERVEQHRFSITDNDEHLYRLHSADHRIDIVFINDKEQFTIHADYLEGKRFHFQNSPANTSLHQFLQSMNEKMEMARKKQLKDPALTKVIEEAQADYRNYVDTVASPAAALYIYNAVDFGNDRKGLGNYIERLGKRFPTHPGLQKLVADTRNYLSIFEDELLPGDTAPDLALPDITGALIPLSFYRGQYLFIDFWASWDGPSRAQGAYKKKAFTQIKNKKFSMVSISLDPEQEAWKMAVAQDGYTWPQLIDEKVWMGPAVFSFKFDSIPFNFLVDPNGKIIGKALYGDSLLIKLNQLIR